MLWRRRTFLKCVACGVGVVLDLDVGRVDVKFDSQDGVRR